jgi:drug/metabolite transporter (DMT)-like permease
MLPDNVRKWWKADIRACSRREAPESCGRRKAALGSYVKRVGLALLGVIAFVAIGVGIENETGLPFAKTYRVACAVICLLFILKLRSDYPEERWPQASLWAALIVNVGLFFTPLVNRPASRGELMLFALPDAIIVLIASYPALDEHRRAMRQQMILGLVVAVAFCAILFALMLVGPKAVH